MIKQFFSFIFKIDNQFIIAGTLSIIFSIYLLLKHRKNNFLRISTENHKILNEVKFKRIDKLARLLTSLAFLIIGILFLLKYEVNILIVTISVYLPKFICEIIFEKYIKKLK